MIETARSETEARSAAVGAVRVVGEPAKPH